MKASVVYMCGLLLFVIPVRLGAQESTPTVQRDAGAIALAQQAVAATGGATALTALHRWKATGSLAYPASSSIQGTVTVTIEAAEQRKFREDVQTPNGLQSTVIADGVGVRKDAEGKKHRVSTRQSENLNAVLFPARRLNEALADTSVAIVDRGTQTIDGRELHEIGIYQGIAVGSRGNAANESDFFIDPASQQIVAFREPISQEFRPDVNVPHEFIYSNFQPVSGIQTPFSVEERIMGHSVSTLTIQQVELNPEIADSEFVAQ